MRYGGFVVVLALAGCGGDGPVLSDLRLSSESATVGREVVALAHLFDPAGDLEQGRLHIWVDEEDGDASLEGEAPVVDFAPGQLEGEVAVGFTVSGVAPGRYRVALQAENGAGRRSEKMQANLRYDSIGFSPAAILGRR
ncbi:MAG: hypothetical protein H6730_11195 [Deltaproteobacteria bacterium]|nr:hypothetical protein [Deltaproteobacteria bacterium]